MSQHGTASRSGSVGQGLVQCEGRDGNGCTDRPGTLVVPGRLCRACQVGGRMPRHRAAKDATR